MAGKVPYELVHHGVTRTDPYYWMRLTDEQKTAEMPDSQTQKVLDYLNAENAYLASVMKHTETLQQKLYDEIVGRIKQDDSTVPVFDNGYWYYIRYEQGKEYAIHCRRKGTMDAPEEITVDENNLAAGHDFFSLSGLSVSPDNRVVAYGIDTVGRRWYTICFNEIESGMPLPDRLVNTEGDITWGNDSKTTFYTTKDAETLRSDRIWRHTLGTPQAEDKTIYHETDETFSAGIFKTRSRKYLVIASYQTLSTEYWYLDADNPGGQFTLFQAREKDHEYSVDHLGDHFFIRTNSGGAKNFRLMKTPVNKTEKKYWMDVLPHRDSVLLENFELFNDYLVAEERIGGLTRLRVIRWDGKGDHYLDTGEETYVISIHANPQLDTKLLRYHYSSLTTPSSIYDYDMESRAKKLLKQDEVLGGFDRNNYESRRLFAIAPDATRVPISLVYRKGIGLDGSHPLLLYGYGSYGFSTDPYFRSDRLSLLDRGFIYAIAHVRGGSEMGRQWYEDGKLLKKINTFTDFNACARYLIEQNYTNPGRLFAMGGSAGGLLIGAVINLEPQLYRGVVAAVPFVDVVTTMLDESIPLTTSEYDEWGNPNQKEYFDYMLSYSPYDNVKAMDYPNILVTTGFWDSQVQYWEPAKWVARLRNMKTDNNRLLFSINMDAGHGGASGRFRRYREIALEYAFMLDLAGIKE